MDLNVKASEKNSSVNVRIRKLVLWSLSCVSLDVLWLDGWCRPMISLAMRTLILHPCSAACFPVSPTQLEPEIALLRIPTFLYNFIEIRLHIEELLRGVGSSRRRGRAITQTFFIFRKKAKSPSHYLGFHDLKKSISLTFNQYAWINIGIILDSFQSIT